MDETVHKLVLPPGYCPFPIEVLAMIFSHFNPAQRSVFRLANKHLRAAVDDIKPKELVLRKGFNQSHRWYNTPQYVNQSNVITAIDLSISPSPSFLVRLERFKCMQDITLNDLIRVSKHAPKLKHLELNVLIYHGPECSISLPKLEVLVIDVASETSEESHTVSTTYPVSAVVDTSADRQNQLKIISPNLKTVCFGECFVFSPDELDCRSFD